MTGIMLNTVDVNQKTMANSIANLTYNIFGFLPAPFVLGVIIQSGEGENYFAGWMSLMYYSIIPIVSFIAGALIIKRKDLFNWEEAEQN